MLHLQVICEILYQRQEVHCAHFDHARLFRLHEKCKKQVAISYRNAESQITISAEIITVLTRYRPIVLELI